MADAGDSKSPEARPCEGSTPSSGTPTNRLKLLQIIPNPKNPGSSLGARKRGAANAAIRASLYDQLEAALGDRDIDRALHLSRRLRRGERAQS